MELENFRTRIVFFSLCKLTEYHRVSLCFVLKLKKEKENNGTVLKALMVDCLRKFHMLIPNYNPDRAINWNDLSMFLV